MNKEALVLMWDQFKSQRPMAVVNSWGSRRYIYNMDRTHVEYSRYSYDSTTKRIRIKNFLRWVNKPSVYRGVSWKPSAPINRETLAEMMYNE